jgi:hypothetical protein
MVVTRKAHNRIQLVSIGVRLLKESTPFQLVQLVNPKKASGTVNPNGRTAQVYMAERLIET